MPEIDAACKVVRFKPDAEMKPEPEPSRPISPPPVSSAPITPLVILDLKGTVVKVFNDSFGLILLSDGETLVLATIQAAMMVKSEPLFKAFPVGCQVWCRFYTSSLISI